MKTETVRDLHDKAMEFAILAHIARQKGEHQRYQNEHQKAEVFFQEAETLSRRGYEYEKQAAERVAKEYANDRKTSEPTRSILYRSAAALAYHAKEFDDAKRLIVKGLFGYPSERVKQELEDLYNQVEKKAVAAKPIIKAVPTDIIGLMSHEETPIIEGYLERTQQIIHDLRKLEGAGDLSKQTVWSSSFMSAFAIDPSEPFDDEKYHKALLEKRDTLLSLADQGCLIRCIISPPNAENFMPSTASYVLHQTLFLLNFLNRSKESALGNIEWAVSPKRQKNLYIIGRLACLEGYKRGNADRGYDWTLRQTIPDAIDSYIFLYNTLFDQLSSDTLKIYGGKSEANESRREALRQATVNCLKQSVMYLLREIGIPEDENVRKVVVPILKKALNDENQEFRDCVEEALCKLDTCHENPERA
jgi:hypothetical protein